MSLRRVSSCLPGLALMWVAVPMHAVEVHVDYDSTVDFSHFASIGWLEGTPAEDPLLERKIHATIERELIPDGLKEVREEPDLLLLSHSSIEAARTFDVAAFPYWVTYQGWRQPLVAVDEIYDSPTGMLIVDVLDGETGELIWRAVATGIVAKKVEKRDEKVDQVMAKMFRGFPPKYKPGG